MNDVQHLGLFGGFSGFIMLIVGVGMFVRSSFDLDQVVNRENFEAGRVIALLGIIVLVVSGWLFHSA